MTVASMGDINREIAKRCQGLHLQLDCGADGLFNAEIAIISEAPGERERIMKLPLVGNSGKYLWEALRQYGINRRSVYISNVVKKQLRVAGSDDKTTISRNEVDQYASILRWELEQLPNLKYVVCLGNYALEALTGLSGITHHRGSVYQSQINSISLGTTRVVTVYPMLNPAAVLREPKGEVLFRFDVGKLDRVLRGEVKEYLITSHINPTPDEAIRWIEKMQDEGKPTSLDIETIGGETACIGLANGAHEGMCINFRDRSHNLFSVHDETRVRVRLQRWFDERGDTKPRLIMQNGMFDASWLAYKDRLILPPSYFDTMLAHHTLYPTLPHNLGFLTAQYTDHPFYKDDGKEWREGGDIDTFWRYNVTDCCITHEVHRRELVELEMQRLDDFFFNHVMRLQPHLIRMTVGGVLVDRSLKQQISEDLALEVQRLKKEFWEAVHEATGEENYNPNPASPKQMSELYFRKLRLVGRGIATDAKNRARMKSHPKTTEAAKKMLTAQDKLAKEQKFFSTYAESQIDEDDRARCEYKQTGVQSAPGRLSSSAMLWGTGMNLQNQPARAQKMFIADIGYMFSYFDLTQAEAQVVGYRAVIPEWMEQYRLSKETGYDSHRALASTMFGVPYDEVPKEDWEADEVTPTIRYKSKRCRHGLNYTLGGDNLAEQIGVSYREGEELHRTYHRVTPQIEKWWTWQFTEVRKTKEMFNAYGRRWRLMERLDENMLGNIVAFYPQSTIGDKVSRCIYLCESDPDWPKDARILLNIHDALIAIHRPSDGQIVRAIMKKYAEEPINILGVDGQMRTLVIGCELKKSVPGEDGIHRWSGLVKVKDE